ncbi:hypothetical protein SLEP1_g14376 [Rubroshorea leprosula]|uniref:Uncharacterized protein n=1 Tax=Rubroshorea leprosula TaxID=152421 RepID=A0AAV5ISP4_9ROSI|nr:hypothetical protein SLEP1_g14376 [Rubroshorea leprosula]
MCQHLFFGFGNQLNLCLEAVAAAVWEATSISLYRGGIHGNISRECCSQPTYPLIVNMTGTTMLFETYLKRQFQCIFMEVT